MELDLSSIPITDNFLQIDAEYKKFKRNIYKEMCDKDQQSLDLIEKDLINSINSLMQAETSEDEEDDHMRALIGARILSKYSKMNQETSVDVFSKISDSFPQSIHKRLFLFKSIAKVSKHNFNNIWDNYLQETQQKIINFINRQRPDEIDIANALIYFDFLHQYSPHFLSQFSTVIILQLIRLVRQNSYTFDLKYDILSKTNQTVDEYFSGGNTFYANNSIELMRKILSKSKSIHHQSVAIDKILTSASQDDKLKSLEILTIFLSNCGNSFLERNFDAIQNFLNFNDDDQRIQILTARNLIYCLRPDEPLNETLAGYLFSVDQLDDPSLICGRLQNLNLLISLKQGKESRSKIIEFVSEFVDFESNNSEDEKEVRDSAFDVLNTFCLFNDDSDIGQYLFNSEFSDRFFSTIHFKSKELSRLMFDFMPEEFFTILSDSIQHDTFETLLFLNNGKIIDEDESEEEDFYIIDNLKSGDFDDFDGKIVQPILNNIGSENADIRSLVPLVLVKVSQESFFSNDHLPGFFDRMQNDPSDQVRLAIIESFNYALIHNSDADYRGFIGLFNDSIENLFDSLILNNASEILRKMAIKFLCLSSKLNLPVIKEKFRTFASDFLNINDKSMISQKQSNDSKYLPSIIDAYPNLFDDELDTFYNHLFNFMKNVTNENQSKSLFQTEFYENLFCSFSQIIESTLENCPSLINGLIEFCLQSLHIGVTELETQNILSLLEHCLYQIGIEKTIELNDKKLYEEQTNLYEIVFKTGSSFDSCLINKHVFRILSFVGVQVPEEKEEAINLKPDWRSEVKHEMTYIDQDDTERKIIYSICSEILYKILNDKSISFDIHINSLKTLTCIQKFISLETLNIESEFERALDIYIKMLENSNEETKRKLVPFLIKFVWYESSTVHLYAPKLIQCLIDYWDLGSSLMLQSYANNLNSDLANYLDDKIIPLILKMEDPTQSLVTLFVEYCFDEKDCPFSFDIIQHLINMINDNNIKALPALNRIIPNVTYGLNKYIPLIIAACLKLISNNPTDKKYFNESAEVLITLSKCSKFSDENYSTFNENLPLILENIPSFSEDMNLDDDSYYDEYGQIIDTQTLFDDSSFYSNNNYFNENEFISLFSSINKVSEKDNDYAVYVQQWLNDLVLLCIKNSPNVIIKNIFTFVKLNPSFAFSMFNISFYCVLNYMKSNSGGYNEKVVLIRDTFLHLLKMKKLPSNCQTVLSHLVEFLDRAELPIFDTNYLASLPSPITSIFSSNPPLSLRYTMLNYYEQIKKLKRKSLNDLKQAYLNNGYFDQYQHFISINHKKSDANDAYNYLLPINVSTVEDIHNLQNANHLFLSKQWEHFNHEIESNDSQIVTHLFKAASLIQQYWSDHSKDGNDSNISNDFVYHYEKHDDDNNFQSKMKILEEINRSFDSIGEESVTIFSRPKPSINQMIVYGQQLIELQEMFLSNGVLNNFNLRFTNSDQISSFIYPILLLRIEAKGNEKSSLSEKVCLLSICRRNKKWNLMNKYYNHFYNSPNSNVPVEIEYEMMYNKLENNEATESEIDSLLSKVKALKEEKKNSPLQGEYEYSNLEDFVKYQKALFYSRSSTEASKLKEVLLLCKNSNNPEVINLWSWVNLKLFEIENEIDYYMDQKSNEYYFHFKGYRIVYPQINKTAENKNKLINSKKEKIDYSYLIEAIKGYIRSVIINEKLIVPNMTSIISLLFNHLTNNDCIREIRNELNSVPLHFYLDTVPLIISYIHQIKDDEFGHFIIDLLISLMEKYPRGVIYDYSFSLFSDKRLINNDKIIPSPIQKVKNHFIKHPEKLIENKCENIFNEVEHLTKNLYSISNDFFSITYNFLKYVIQFTDDEEKEPHSKEEILSFVNDLSYVNDEYIKPFCIAYKNDTIKDYTQRKSVHEQIRRLGYNGRGYVKHFHEDIHSLIDAFICIVNDRERIKFLNETRPEKEKVSHTIPGFDDKEKRPPFELVSDPNVNAYHKNLNEFNPLTSSTKVKPKRILSDMYENEDDFLDKQTQLNSAQALESSDSFEINLSASYAIRKTKFSSTNFFNESDDDENEKFKKPRPDFRPEERSAEDIKNMKRKSELDKFKHNYESHKSLITDLEINIDANTMIAIEIPKNLKRFRGEIINVLRKSSSSEFKLEDENPEILKTKDLSLPIFGTFRFNEEPILIHKFENEIIEFQSAARPKCINIIGSDGKTYAFILKSTEDLRLDQRTMILFKYLNRFLKTRIRTYSVTPLTVQFGLLQKVEQTNPIETLIESYRKKHGTSFIENQKLFKIYRIDSNAYDKKENYEKTTIFETILRNTPNSDIDLRESMYLHAPDAEGWTKYMINFSKSTAVNSIVGYIIGLGDRHLNNILINMKDGFAVHIDLADCFEIDQIRSRCPEKVPFRLTRNLVKMFGPCGCDGTFRTGCEETLALIRENREMIFNILEVFYISPIQVFSAVRDMRRNMTDINLTSNKSENAMKRIKTKLDGRDKTVICDKHDTNPSDNSLSVHDQVDMLISYATNSDNLSLNFSGWRAWV